MRMTLRQETILHTDMQRVVTALHHEETAVRPYADQYRRLLETHGKMIRASLVLTFARAFGTSKGRLADRVVTGAAAIEMLHLATLVHDDVLDGATVRRNEPTVQTIVGNKVAIYLGDLILSRYMEIVSQIAPRLDFVREQSSTLREIVAGELLQESARHHAETTVEHYIQAISGKTAALFRLSCLTGLRLNAEEPDESWLRTATEFGQHLGIAFQIVDDIEDFNIAHDTGKPKLEDISDGIYTLPVLLALRDDPSCKRLLDDPHAVLSYLTEHPGPMNESKQIASRHVHQAADALADSPMHEPTRQLLTEMLQRFASRI